MMNMPATKLLAVIACVCAAMPFLVWRLAEAKLQRAREASARVASDLGRLEQESSRLSRLAAEKLAGPAASTGQKQEMNRLRSEAKRLSEEIGSAESLRSENRLLREKLIPANQLKGGELDAALSAQALEAMKNICRELPVALQRFAADHRPKGTDDALSLTAIRDYFPTQDGRRMPGLLTFEFVREGGPRAEDSLLLREQSSRQRNDGNEARVYGFRDGTAVEVTAENGNFDLWEKQHLSSGPD